jgi:hypothetical protein
MTLDGKMTKTKFIDLKKVYNIAIDNIFIQFEVLVF